MPISSNKELEALKRKWKELEALKFTRKDLKAAGIKFTKTEFGYLCIRSPELWAFIEKYTAGDLQTISQAILQQTIIGGLTIYWK